MHPRPSDVVLGVLSQSDALPLTVPGCIRLLSSIFALRRGAPARLIVGPGPALIEDPDGLALNRSNPLLVSVTSPTEESRSPWALLGRGSRCGTVVGDFPATVVDRFSLLPHLGPYLGVLRPWGKPVRFVGAARRCDQGELTVKDESTAMTSDS
jgi:hypothetical protein